MARLPLLSTYLGHSKVSGTATYLHVTPELLEEADRRFRAFTFPLFAKAHRDEG